MREASYAEKRDVKEKTDRRLDLFYSANQWE